MMNNLHRRPATRKETDQRLDSCSPPLSYHLRPPRRLPLLDEDIPHDDEAHPGPRLSLRPRASSHRIFPIVPLREQNTSKMVVCPAMIMMAVRGCSCSTEGAGSVRYRIEVAERIARAFDVEASSSKEAMARIVRLYLDEGIVVESDAAPTVTFRVVEG